MNDLCRSKGFYVQGCALVAGSVANYYKVSYNRVTTAPSQVCIAETDNYAKQGVPQHFFVYDPATKKRLDPLDSNPQWETNTYRIVSYRVFGFKKASVSSSNNVTSKEEVMDVTKEFKTKNKKLVGCGFCFCI